MSADNYMVVRKIGDFWHAWMVLGGYTEEEWTTPGGYSHRAFQDKWEAIDYAADVCAKENVEYGLRILED